MVKVRFALQTFQLSVKRGLIRQDPSLTEDR